MFIKSIFNSFLVDEGDIVLVEIILPKKYYTNRSMPSIEVNLPLFLFYLNVRRISVRKWQFRSLIVFNLIIQYIVE